MEKLGIEVFAVQLIEKELTYTELGIDFFPIPDILTVFTYLWCSLMDTI